MSPSKTRWLPILLAVACLISAGNAALYWSLLSRFGHVEETLSSLVARSSTADATGEEDNKKLAYGAGKPPHDGASGISDLGPIPSPDEQIQQLKQQKAAYDPVDEAAKLDRLMAQEPSLPALEQSQVRLLQQAMQNMPPNAPQAAGLQTTCRGRRCLISAGFTDDLQASEWANRLLLVGGKNLPKSARIVAVPLEGGNGAVSLQLYLY